MAEILIIEDSTFQRNFLSKAVTEAGHTVTEAANGREGLEKIVAEAPDLVLCDLLMPEMGGIELLEDLDNRGIKLPVIVVTADIQETTRQRCLELGVSTVLNKPPKAQELLDAIEAVLKTGGGSS